MSGPKNYALIPGDFVCDFLVGAIVFCSRPKRRNRIGTNRIANEEEIQPWQPAPGN
jgi:hypothetical protein